MRSLSPRAPSFRPAALLLACLALGATLLGCGKPAYVRGSDVAGLDDAAMGTGLDRRDIEKLLHENLKSFSSSGAVLSWGATRPTMAAVAQRLAALADDLAGGGAAEEEAGGVAGSQEARV